jgi:hypothetical protein
VIAIVRVIYVLPLEIQLSREEDWDPINWFDPTTFLCLSEARTWISNVICRGFVCVQWIQLRWEVIFRFIYIIIWINCHWYRRLCPIRSIFSDYFCRSSFCPSFGLPFSLHCILSRSPIYFHISSELVMSLVSSSYLNFTL